MEVSEKQKKEIAQLSRRKHRIRQQAFVVEGVRSVDAALNARAPLKYLLSTPESRSTERDRRAEALGGLSLVVSARELAKISDVENSQGVLAVVALPPSDPSSLLKRDHVLILDGIQDPGNVGTLLRTAAWFGVGAVLAGPRTADFFNGKVVRASMGGIWDLELAETDHLENWCAEWTAADRGLYAADMTGRELSEWTPAIPSALVIGGETSGLSKELNPLITERVHITSGSDSRITESLNASVAGALVMASWMRRLL